MNVLKAAIIGLALFLATPVLAETKLLMAEEPGCVWCERWLEEIGPIYPKTAEGRTAPLQRYDLFDGAPDGIEFSSRVSFTPTFILVENGKEVGRIEGYPGQDFFWGLLGVLFERGNISLEQTG